MMIKKVGSGLKYAGAAASSVFGLFVLMLVMGTSTASAQSFYQGQDAINILKNNLSELQEKDCKKDVQGVTPQVAQQMNNMRCEYVGNVLSGIQEVFNPASIETGQRINAAHSKMTAKYPNASVALARLKQEVEQLLRI
jgi:predicted PurR-regulated permease PerM